MTVIIATRVMQIRACRAQLVKLSAALEARVAEQMIPTGLGSLTLALLDGEVCNWHRFKHRKAIGSYTGCCPSEYSSGGVQRFGPIDRQGNKHGDATLHLTRIRPNFRAFQEKYPNFGSNPDLDFLQAREPASRSQC